MDYLPLSRGRGVTVVDDDLYDLLSKYRWSLTNGYVQAWIDGKQVLLHRYVMGAEPGQEIDHINGIKVDNRKENLRFVTRSQNCRNLHTFKHGATWVKRKQKWQAQIRVNGKNKWLGYFPTEQDAKDCYDKYVRVHFRI